MNLQGSHFLDCVTGEVHSDGKIQQYFDPEMMKPGLIIDILLDRSNGTIQWVLNAMTDAPVLERPSLTN